jgi:hypothetical protein
MISSQEALMNVGIKEEDEDTENEVIEGSDPEFEDASEFELDERNDTNKEDDRGESKSEALPTSKYNA